MTEQPTIKPVRIYRSSRGIWQAEIERDGRLAYFSLHTRSELEARERWQKYVQEIRADLGRNPMYIAVHRGTSGVKPPARPRRMLAL